MADRNDLANELVRLASDDEAAARAMLDVSSVTDAIVGFHPQQAVEKALKAVLAGHGVEFPFTHDLDALVELCERAGLTLPAALADVDRLTPYGVGIRYGMSNPGTVARPLAQQWAALAVAWARLQLSAEA